MYHNRIAKYTHKKQHRFAFHFLVNFHQLETHLKKTVEKNHYDKEDEPCVSNII